MNKGKDRTVYRNSRGKWVDKRNDSKKPTGVYQTQRDAIRSARRNLMIEGGGDLIVFGEGNRIRSISTIPFGNALFPPRDV